MRILLAGVPFGCGNVGDEAILECAVRIFREACPGAGITAGTRDGKRTAQRLGIETCGLLGFYGDVSPAETSEIVAAHDCVVWCGATGLSDYPEVTVELMRLAQQLGKKTILWGVGMNDELNPAFYRIQPGKRRLLLEALSAVSLRSVDAIAVEERRRNNRARRKIAACVDAADLVVARDARSRDEVLKCGVAREVVVGADSAILMQPATLENMPLAPGVRDLLLSGAPKMGLCVSAQGAIAKEQELAVCLDEIASEANVYIVGIPMNPLTDSALMARLGGLMPSRDRMLVLTGEYRPAEVLAIASRMNVIVSSRLHLLIFAAIAGVPIVGVSRGSKVDTFLRPFGRSTVGSVHECDFRALKNEVLSLSRNAQPFRDRCAEVLAEDFRRLDSVRLKLAEFLSGVR